MKLVKQPDQHLALLLSLLLDHDHYLERNHDLGNYYKPIR